MLLRDDGQPIRAFKHMRSCHADGAMATGQFQISRLSDFRREEFGPLADVLDGATSTIANDELISSAEFAQGTPRVRALSGLIALPQSECVSGGGGLMLRDVGLLRFTPDHWALCLSARPDGAAAGVYDATVEVMDLHAFACAIRRAHPDTLGPYQIGRVDYRERKFIIGDGLKMPDHFVKEPRFSQEDEIRIVWQAKSSRQKPLRTIARAAVQYLRRGH